VRNNDASVMAVFVGAGTGSTLLSARTQTQLRVQVCTHSQGVEVQRFCLTSSDYLQARFSLALNVSNRISIMAVDHVTLGSMFVVSSFLPQPPAPPLS
jgi:hypothetical protein